jgi:hypothetical protein
MTMRFFCVLMIGSALMLGVAGCDDNSAERAADKTGDALEKAGDKTGDALEKAGDKTGDALEKAGDKTSDAVK